MRVIRLTLDLSEEPNGIFTVLVSGVCHKYNIKQEYTESREAIKSRWLNQQNQLGYQMIPGPVRRTCRFIIYENPAADLHTQRNELQEAITLSGCQDTYWSMQTEEEL